ncbi:hypothetical protein D3C72_1144360 [compost metagenome]
MHGALHAGQRPLAPLHDGPAGLGERGDEDDDERQHRHQDDQAHATRIQHGRPRTHAHRGRSAALRHGVDLAFHDALLNEQHDGDNGDRHHRHGALQRGAAAHFADEGVVRHDRQQRHAAAQQHRQRKVADHQREYHQRVHQHRRQQHGHQHAQAGQQGRRAQAEAGFFQLAIEAAQRGQHAKINVGVVDERHGKHHARPAVEGRQRDTHVAQQIGQQAVVAQEQQPGLAHDDLGNHDGQHRQDRHQVLQGEVVARDQIGERHAHQHGAGSDRQAQDQRVAEGLQVLGIGQQGLEAFQGKAAVLARDAVAEQHAQRIQHEEQQQDQADCGQDAPGPPFDFHGGRVLRRSRRGCRRGSAPARLARAGTAPPYCRRAARRGSQCRCPARCGRRS